MIVVNRRRAGSVLLTVLAGGLLALLIRQLGVGVILELCLRLGPVLPAILALTFCKFPLEATGWRLVLPPAQRPPWWPTLRATLCGEAIGFVTLTGPVAGEPMRAALLKQFVPLPVGIAAGAVERSVYASTGALVTAAALAIAASRSGGSRGAALAAAAVAALPIVVVLLARRHGSRRPAGSTSEWRAVLRDLWSDRRGTLHVMALLCLAQHLVMISEAYVLLHALGASPTLPTVLMFEGVSKLANTVGAIVPGRLGIAEGSSAALAGALGIGSAFGVALVLMRRVRGLLWAIVGLAVFVPELWRRSRGLEAATAPAPQEALPHQPDEDGEGRAPSVVRSPRCP